MRLRIRFFQLAEHLDERHLHSETAALDVNVTDTEAGRLPEPEAGVSDDQDEEVVRRRALRRQLLHLGVREEPLPSSTLPRPLDPDRRIPGQPTVPDREP
jgi:hypothetical protein